MLIHKGDKDATFHAIYTWNILTGDLKLFCTVWAQVLPRLGYEEQASLYSSYTSTFEKQTAKRQHSDHHPNPRFGKDFRTVIKVLLKDNEVQGRQHSTFKFRKGLMEALSRC